MPQSSDNPARHRSAVLQRFFCTRECSHEILRHSSQRHGQLLQALRRHVVSTGTSHAIPDLNGDQSKLPCRRFFPGGLNRIAPSSIACGRLRSSHPPRRPVSPCSANAAHTARACRDDWDEAVHERLRDQRFILLVVFQLRKHTRSITTSFLYSCGNPAQSR